MNIKTKFEPGDNVRFGTGRGTKTGKIKSIEINNKGMEYLIDTGGIVYAKKEEEIEEIN